MHAAHGDAGFTHPGGWRARSGTIGGMRRLFNTLALTLAIYGFAAWVYVAVVAIALPKTLPWQLTHLASWPRTDTFGELSFVVSLLAFIAYRLTRGPRPEH